MGGVLQVVAFDSHCQHFGLHTGSAKTHSHRFRQRQQHHFGGSLLLYIKGNGGAVAVSLVFLRLFPHQRDILSIGKGPDGLPLFFQMTAQQNRVRLCQLSDGVDVQKMKLSESSPPHQKQLSHR